MAALKTLSKYSVGQIVFAASSPQWHGFPLNLICMPAQGEFGRTYTDCPKLYWHMDGNGRRSFKQNGTVHDINIIQGAIDLITSDYQQEWCCWEATQGNVLELSLPRPLVNSLVPEVSGFDLLTRYQLNDLNLRICLNELLLEAQRGEHSDRLYVESLSVVLVAYLSKSYADCKVAGNANAGGFSGGKKRYITELIESRLGQEISIVDLAKEVDLSPSHFFRCFKVSFGLSPYAYILARRIEEAKKMLKTSSLSISDIALSIGFSSHTHFAQTFLKYVGMTPSRWRNL